jgi:ABC-type antimicrobial peptide transport system permease subunit
VVKDANYGNLRGKTRSLIYCPTQGENLLVVRVAGTPAAFLSTIRKEIQAVDKNLEVTSIRTVPQILDQALVQEGLLAKLSSFFGLLALLLACIGLYGVMSYDVARRTHEIGVRMALGAPGGAVLRMVLREMLWLLTLGLLFGLAGAVATTKLIESLLFGLAPTDPPTLTLAVLLLLGVATITAWLPARRAARIDPLIALRHE